jgi:6-phosphofructokinase
MYRRADVGGDASGMNAAIRAVTRSAIFNGFRVKGIYRGYEGLINDEIKELTTQDVSSIIQRAVQYKNCQVD